MPPLVPERHAFRHSHIPTQEASPISFISSFIPGTGVRIVPNGVIEKARDKQRKRYAAAHKYERRNGHVPQELVYRSISSEMRRVHGIRDKVMRDIEIGEGTLPIQKAGPEGCA